MLQTIKFVLCAMIFLGPTACREEVSKTPNLADIAISEIMYSPDVETPCGEFVEIINKEKRTVNLEGWSFNAGIRFEFLKDAKIKSGQQMVVSSKSCPSGVASFGTFKGRLNNDGETLRLVDNNSKVVDEVTYDDDRGWPYRAEGYGQSLERIHTEMPSSLSGSWALGPVGGTPAKANQTQISKPLPLIVEIEQSPVEPSPSQPVSFQACVHHINRINSVSIHYRLENETKYTVAALHPTTNKQCLVSGGSLYQGTLSPFKAPGVVEFWIEAVSQDKMKGRFPREPQDRNAFFVVEDSHLNTHGIRVIMTQKDTQAFNSRSQHSDELVPVSVIKDGRIHYNAGLRLRGLSSRGSPNKDYRLDFSENSSFDGPRRMNILCNRAGPEYIGLLSFDALGMVSVHAKPISLLLGSKSLPRCLESERVSPSVLKRYFTDSTGAIYKGVSQVLPKDRTSNPKEELQKYRKQGPAVALFGKDTQYLLDGRLDYRGIDQSMYRFSYMQIGSNGIEDLSPIVNLSKVMSRTPRHLLIRELSKLINVEQWTSYFAARQVLGDSEHGLHSRQGVDYYIYKDPVNNRQHLIPWDFDQVLTRHDIPIHHHKVRSIMRFIRHPEIAPKYAAAIVKMVDGPLSPIAMRRIIKKAAPVLTIEETQFSTQKYDEIVSSNLAQIPRALSANGNVEMTSMLPVGEEIWEASCTEWDDPVHKLPKCEVSTGNDANERLEIQFTQNFIVPAADIVKSARISLVLDDVFWKNVLISSKGFFQDRVGTIGFEINGETVHGIEDEVAKINSDESRVSVKLPRGMLKDENTMVMSIAAPRDFMSHAMSLFHRRIVVPNVKLEATWDGKPGRSILLQGQADATRTRHVEVEGLDAGYVPWRGSWFTRHIIKKPVECLDVRAFDENNKVFETLRIGLVEGKLKKKTNLCSQGEETADKWIVY